MDELQQKLALVRAGMARAGLGAVRLRGNAGFSWLCRGASAAVLLTSESAVAEAVVTPDGAFVLTDDIEAPRLLAEEGLDGLDVVAHRWWDEGAADAFVAGHAGGLPVASDRPRGAERPLPGDLEAARWSLLPPELERYRALGRDAANAVTDTLQAIGPALSEHDLAAVASAALWARGIHPALTLVAGERRLPRFRHPTPSAEPLGRRAMLVVCARRHGLYANLTRFVAFGPLSPAERALHEDVARVEAAALAASRPGATLGEVFGAIVDAYAALGHAGQEERHHQGGPCGYLSREVVARPGSSLRLAANGAVAWNPSLPGAKVEDTFVASDTGLELLTHDPRWPAVSVDGRDRPAVLVR